MLVALIRCVLDVERSRVRGVPRDVWEAHCSRSGVPERGPVWVAR